MAAIQTRPRMPRTREVITRPNAAILVRLDQTARDNTAYRQVLLTTQQMQIVAMNVLDRVPAEVHKYSTQSIHVVSGRGRGRVGDFEFQLSADVAFVIPAGLEHEIINTNEREPMKLIVTYAPPLHEPDERTPFRDEE